MEAILDDSFFGSQSSVGTDDEEPPPEFTPTKPASEAFLKDPPVTVKEAPSEPTPGVKKQKPKSGFANTVKPTAGVHKQKPQSALAGSLKPSTQPSNQANKEISLRKSSDQLKKSAVLLSPKGRCCVMH